MWTTTGQRELAFFMAAALWAATADARVRGADDFLPPEQAFKASARALDDRTVELAFDIAPGYYLYREQFRFSASGATLGTAVVPPGQVKFDDTFQKNVETHRGLLRIAVPVQQAAGMFRLVAGFQGCADKGLCYPPTQWQADMRLIAFGGTASVEPRDEAGADPTALAQTPAASTAPGPAAMAASVEPDRAVRAWWPWAAAIVAAVAAFGIVTLVRRRR